MNRNCLVLVSFISAIVYSSLGGVRHAAAQDNSARVVETSVNETLTLSFQGPQTSETATPNPFTDYRLLVEFTQGDLTHTVRGFYAADGNAGESGADAGDVWQVRFAPEIDGQWSYTATLKRGAKLSINDDPKAGENVPLKTNSGKFNVSVATAESDSIDMRHRGRLTTDGRYYRFANNGPYWIKGGTNSPENLLAYVGFDNTYRVAGKDREGEAKVTDGLHKFETHVADWKAGDTLWHGDKGKGLIGAINYLSSTGMNAIYFLTMNIGGDGKDVWPYITYDDFTRFDCSKLDQWEIVFEHMQRRGMQMHVVTQETENEKLLDNGDTGDQRKLYYRELIARFAHHPAIVWNLGEENGPQGFSPNGQNDEQRTAMTDYIAAHDPYGNPILLHTHASKSGKDEILPAMLGLKSLAGLSLQVGSPKNVHAEILQWRKAADDAGHPWAISMDEIGPADAGAITDAEDPRQDVMRGPVLWATLLAGGSGVEWYFGYKHPHTDLTCEDWRSRDTLWKQTKISLDFFQHELPYWKMQPHDDLVSGSKNAYCLAEVGSTYAIYHPAQPDLNLKLDLKGQKGEYSIAWLDPRNGGALQTGSIGKVRGGSQVDIGLPPQAKDDWVALVRRSKDANVAEGFAFTEGFSASAYPGVDYAQPLRPQIHFSSKRNWLNDPNGMVYDGEKYHLFFQHNPNGTKWGNMTWGHATSPDMVHWTQLDHALLPYEVDGQAGTIFSGTAVIDHNNSLGKQVGDTKTICAFFTFATKPKFYQAMAYSTDNGATFNYWNEGRAVVPHQGFDEGERDPKVFWHEASHRWVMMLWVCRDPGRVRIFTSKNLVDWKVSSDLMRDWAYECMDTIFLPVDGNPDNVKCVIYDASFDYEIGSFDGKTFNTETGPLIAGGGNFYAAQTFNNSPDDRTVQIGWMNGGPDVADAHGLLHNQQMSFPCELTLRTTDQGVRLFAWPVEEIMSLVDNSIEIPVQSVRPNDNALGGMKPIDLADVEIEFAPNTAETLIMEFPSVTLTYATKTQRLSCTGVDREGQIEDVTIFGKLEPKDGIIKLRFLIDRLSVEIYAFGGEQFRAKYFSPKFGTGKQSITATGGEAKVNKLEIRQLHSAW